MGFNLGAFAGAAAQSGLSTYERLNEQAFKNLQKQQLEKDMAEKEALDQAWRQSQARVGQQDEYGQAIKTEGFTGTQQAKMLSDQGALPSDTADAREFEQEAAKSAAGALRENAVRQGAIPEAKAALPELKPTEYTSKQGMQDYVKAAGQVSRKGTLEALQMKSAIRESDLQDKFDTARDELDNTLAKIKGTAETGGMKGLAEAAKKEGLKVDFIEGKNGVGSRINVIGPKGDVLETISDVGSATKKLSQAAMQQFYDKSINLLGSSDKVIAAMQGERKIAIQEREAADKGAYYRAAAGNLSAKANSFVEKLPEKDKFRLNSLNSAVQTSMKAFEANPTPEGQLRVGVNQLKLNKAMKEFNMVGDIYEGTGIPSPQEAAAQIINAKITNKSEIDKRISVARQTLGRDYADEVALALKENAPVKPNKPGAIANESETRVTSPFKQPAMAQELSNLRSAIPEDVKRIRAFGASPQDTQ